VSGFGPENRHKTAHDHENRAPSKIGRDYVNKSRTKPIPIMKSARARLLRQDSTDQSALYLAIRATSRGKAHFDRSERRLATVFHRSGTVHEGHDPIHRNSRGSGPSIKIVSGFGAENRHKTAHDHEIRAPECRTCMIAGRILMD